MLVVNYIRKKKKRQEQRKALQTCSHIFYLKTCFNKGEITQNILQGISHIKSLSNLAYRTWKVELLIFFFFTTVVFQYNVECSHAIFFTRRAQHLVDLNWHRVVPKPNTLCNRDSINHCNPGNEGNSHVACSLLFVFQVMSTFLTAVQHRARYHCHWKCTLLLL